jgi:IS1 family transposase
MIDGECGECGDRSENTATLLLDRLKKIRENLFVDDEYVVEASLIPREPLYQGKDLT